LWPGGSVRNLTVEHAFSLVFIVFWRYKWSGNWRPPAVPGGFRRFPAVSGGSDFEHCRSEIGPWLVQDVPAPAVSGGFRRFRAVPGGLGFDIRRSKAWPWLVQELSVLAMPGGFRRFLAAPGGSPVVLAYLRCVEPEGGKSKTLKLEPMSFGDGLVVLIGLLCRMGPHSELNKTNSLCMCQFWGVYSFDRSSL